MASAGAEAFDEFRYPDLKGQWERVGPPRGASVFKMRDVSRHKSMEVLQGYVRDADMFRDHAGAGLL